MKKIHSKKLVLAVSTVRVLERVTGGGDDDLVSYNGNTFGLQESDSVKAVCCSRLPSGCTGGAL